MSLQPISAAAAGDLARRAFAANDFMRSVLPTLDVPVRNDAQLGRGAALDGGVPGTIGGGFGAPIKARIGLGDFIPYRFEPGSLYGANGQPNRNDIEQNSFGDCYFVATMASVAQANPGLIKNAIHFDPSTGDYTVRLYNKDGKPQDITVTQSEIADNINRHGGSTADNTGQDKRVWPAVMETAYAKMHDSNPADGLDEGYNAVIHGGFPQDAMQAITGDRGDEIQFSQGFFESEHSALDRTGKQLQAALANGRPVTAWTVPENRSIWDRITGNDGKQDGLVDNHVYNVDKVYQDKDGNWMVTLRNPWNTNMGTGEGRETPSATLDVPLSTLSETGGVHAFTVGPAR